MGQPGQYPRLSTALIPPTARTTGKGGFNKSQLDGVPMVEALRVIQPGFPISTLDVRKAIFHIRPFAAPKTALSVVHSTTKGSQSALCHSSSVKRDTDLATAYFRGMTLGEQLTARRSMSRRLQADREGGIPLPGGSNPYNNYEVVASGVGVCR
jgi:hypothetical protein